MRRCNKTRKKHVIHTIFFLLCSYGCDSSSCPMNVRVLLALFLPLLLFSHNGTHEHAYLNLPPVVSNSSLKIVLKFTEQTAPCVVSCVRTSSQQIQPRSSLFGACRPTTASSAPARPTRCSCPPTRWQLPLCIKQLPRGSGKTWWRLTYAPSPMHSY